MLNSKFGNSTEWPNNADQYYQQSGVTVKDPNNLIATNDIFMKGIFTAGAYLFDTKSLLPVLIHIWDSIIMDDSFVSPNTGDFNKDAVINNLNVTIYNMLCDPDEKNDELRKKINSGMKFTCSGGNTLTVSMK